MPFTGPPVLLLLTFWVVVVVPNVRRLSCNMIWWLVDTVGPLYE